MNVTRSGYSPGCSMLMRYVTASQPVSMDPLPVHRISKYVLRSMGRGPQVAKI